MRMHPRQSKRTWTVREGALKCMGKDLLFELDQVVYIWEGLQGRGLRKKANGCDLH